MQLYVIAAKTLTASGTAWLIASKSHRFPLNAGIVVDQLEGVLRKIQAAAKHCGEPTNQRIRTPSLISWPGEDDGSTYKSGHSLWMATQPRGGFGDYTLFQRRIGLRQV